MDVTPLAVTTNDLARHMTAAALLALALASLALLLHGGRLGLWPRPPAAPPGSVRHRHFARLALRTTVHFGLVALLLLALAGRLETLRSFPDELLPARTLALALLGGAPPWQTLAGGLLGGGVIAGLLERRGRRIGLGDVGTLLPARRGELAWGALLAIEAGVTEELFFRLLLPLLIVLAGGSALTGFAVATLLFGYAHRYQGTVGVVATTLAGVLLAFVYLLSAQLWVAIAVHAAIDLNALVVRPLISGRVQ